MSEPTIIERSVEKAHVWLDEIAAELGGGDRRNAYRQLHATSVRYRSFSDFLDRVAADAELAGETAASAGVSAG